MDKPDSVAMITAPLRGALGTVVDRFAENYGARRFSFEAVDQTVVRTAFNRMYGQNRLPSSTSRTPTTCSPSAPTS